MVKRITWDTDYNKKMGCDAFIHIDLAPVEMPAKDILETAVIVIYTKDESHEPIQVRLEYIMCFPLDRVTDQLTLPSHGMDAMEFVDTMFKRYTDKIDFKSPLAIYFYKKITQS